MTWRRTMFACGLAALLVGVVMMVGGGLYAGARLDASAMRGIWVGTVGTLAVVTGVVLLKLAILGPVPASLQEQARAAKGAKEARR